MAGSATIGIAAHEVLRASGAGTEEHKVEARPATKARPLSTGDVERLNVALNLAYLGAQFHGRAAHGAGLPADFLNGVGRQGTASGGRRITFSDAELAGYASEFASDKAAHVAGLRGRLGDRAAAQPAIDLTPQLLKAFDPVSGDDAFLVGAFLVGNGFAALIRALLAGIADAGASATLAAVLADAIYHEGLIRVQIAARAAADPAVAFALRSAGCTRANHRLGDTHDQSPAGRGAGTDLIAADGDAIPFLRTPGQLLGIDYSTLGLPWGAGFFPGGLNGVRDIAEL